MRNSSVCVFRDTYANYILWTICAHVCELSGINRDIENPIVMQSVAHLFVMYDVDHAPGAVGKPNDKNLYCICQNLRIGKTVEILKILTILSHFLAHAHE